MSGTDAIATAMAIGVLMSRVQRQLMKFGQGATGDQTDGRAGAGDRAVNGERLGPLVRLGEGRGDE